MAAPPTINAAQMKQIQADKLAAYNQRLDELVVPIRQATVQKLAQAIQVAVEDPRPVNELSVVANVSTVDAGDLLSVLNRLRSFFQGQLAQQRGFVVVFEDIPKSQTELRTDGLKITLRWP